MPYVIQLGATPSCGTFWGGRDDDVNEEEEEGEEGSQRTHITDTHTIHETMVHTLTDLSPTCAMRSKSK
jgi:hypothetical protein